jgi:hypothetical protein
MTDFYTNTPAKLKKLTDSQLRKIYRFAGNYDFPEFNLDAKYAIETVDNLQQPRKAVRFAVLGFLSVNPTDNEIEEANEELNGCVPKP